MTDNTFPAADSETDDDVQGHGRLHPVVADEDEDDVQGHVRTRIESDEDDVQGHSFRAGIRDQGGYGEGDEPRN